ncbi:hypothetical protein, partial [Phytoactinopolyspora endophytica]|uniref:hypothetical protein n=1 Tax=Phytoactinopolyspora endophytica TaxID=1642495 RepID=UPI0013EB253B
MPESARASEPGDSPYAGLPELLDDHAGPQFDFLDGSTAAGDALRSAVTSVVDAVLSSRHGPPFPTTAPGRLREV